MTKNIQGNIKIQILFSCFNSTGKYVAIKVVIGETESKETNTYSEKYMERTTTEFSLLLSM